MNEMKGSEELKHLEDALLGLYISETEPLIQEIDRSATDMVLEINRFKREKRQARKNAKEVLDSSLMRDANGSPKVIEVFGEKMLNYYVDQRKWIMELKIKLESGVPLPEEIEKLLGFSIDYTQLDLWDQRHIRWQAAAQVLWFIHPEANVEKIKEQLLHSVQLFNWLGFDKLRCVDNVDSRFRNLENYIKLVNPKGRLRGRPRNDEKPATSIIPIPLVCNKETGKINIRALYFAIEAITTVLQQQKITPEEVIDHPIVSKYKTITSPLLEIFIHLWVNETLQGC